MLRLHLLDGHRCDARSRSSQRAQLSLQTRLSRFAVLRIPRYSCLRRRVTAAVRESSLFSRLVVTSLEESFSLLFEVPLRYVGGLPSRQHRLATSIWTSKLDEDSRTGASLTTNRRRLVDGRPPARY